MINLEEYFEKTRCIQIKINEFIENDISIEEFYDNLINIFFEDKIFQNKIVFKMILLSLSDIAKNHNRNFCLINNDFSEKNYQVIEEMLVSHDHQFDWIDKYLEDYKGL